MLRDRSRWCSGPTRRCRAPWRGRRGASSTTPPATGATGCATSPSRSSGRSRSSAPRSRSSCNAFEDTGAIVAAVTTSIPEVRRQRAQLGLSLLLAARRLFRRQRAQPAERDAHDGALPRLHHQRRRGRRAARPAARVLASTARRGIDEREVDFASRLSRHGAGAGRQPGVRAGAERRLRLGDACGDARVLRRRLRAARRRGAVPRSSSRSASARPRSTTSPTPACGSCAARGRVHTFSSVMCWAACDRLAKIAARLGLAERARALARARGRACTR